MAIEPGTLPLRARRRYDFAHVISVPAVDMTDAEGAAQVRLYPGQPDPTQATMSVSIEVFVIDSVPTSRIYLTMDAAVVDGLPTTGEAGAPADLFWDLRISPATGPDFMLLRGPFTVEEVVTHG